MGRVGCGGRGVGSGLEQCIFNPFHPPPCTQRASRGTSCVLLGPLCSLRSSLPAVHDSSYPPPLFNDVIYSLELPLLMLALTDTPQPATLGRGGLGHALSLCCPHPGFGLSFFFPTPQTRAGQGSLRALQGRGCARLGRLPAEAGTRGRRSLLPSPYPANALFPGPLISGRASPCWCPSPLPF